MRDRPKHPPREPHDAPASLLRVRRLSHGVHFGIACVGVLFLVIVGFWVWGARTHPAPPPIIPAPVGSFHGK